MQLSEILPALKRRWYASVVVLVAAIIVGALAAAGLSKAPTGTATVQIFVDSPVSSLVNLQSNTVGLEARASVLAQAMSSDAVIDSIAKSAGVPAADVTAQGPYTGSDEVLDVPTPSEARGMQIVSVKPAYRLTFLAEQDIPIVTVSVVGPDPVAAGNLANHVLSGTDAWLTSLTTSGEVDPGHQIHLRQLGNAQAGTINSSSSKVIGAVGAVAVLMLGILAIVITDPVRRRRRVASS